MDQDSIFLSLADISLDYPDGSRALSHVTLNAAKGEVVSVVGPSGCGKSTLLRIAAGLIHPTEGVCTTREGHLEYVFQDPTLMSWRTVGENVSLLAELAGLDAATTSSRVRDALATVGLTDHAGKYPHQLSGGMRMRTSLARSLVMDPDLFLLDEPFGALDEMSRERLNDELCALVRSGEITTLLVTHSVGEAVYLSDRVLVMTPSPGTLAADIHIPLGRHRSPEIRYSAAFTECCSEVHSKLKAVSA